MFRNKVLVYLGISDNVKFVLIVYYCKFGMRTPIYKTFYTEDTLLIWRELNTGTCDPIESGIVYGLYSAFNARKLFEKRS